MQPLLISNVNDLPEEQRQRLESSWAGEFYREFICRIREETFAVLYADVPSRPNTPVNVLLGLETLKAGYGWSDEDISEGRDVWKHMLIKINGKETIIRTYGEFGAIVLGGRVILLDESFIELTKIDFPSGKGQNLDVQSNSEDYSDT